MLSRFPIHSLIYIWTWAFYIQQVRASWTEPLRRVVPPPDRVETQYSVALETRAVPPTNSQHILVSRVSRDATSRPYAANKASWGVTRKLGTCGDHNTREQQHDIDITTLRKKRDVHPPARYRGVISRGVVGRCGKTGIDQCCTENYISRPAPFLQKSFDGTAIWEEAKDDRLQRVLDSNSN